MTRYGFVASGGGYRSFYSAGALVWLRQQGVPVVHIASTSSGNNNVLDYLLWDWENEPLPPVLARTLRLSFSDIFEVLANFLGLRPSLLPNGSHLLTVEKGSCRKSLLLDDPARRAQLARHLRDVRWDILATNVTRREARYFNVNDILGTIDDDAIDRFMDAFLAGITTIPYFKAVSIEGEYYVEGGYLDNTPLRTVFANPDVDEIIAIDFTDYDFHQALDKLYRSRIFTLPLNAIDMHLLISDMQLTLPNRRVFAQAQVVNGLLEAAGKTAVTIDGRSWHRKPLHVLKPANLEAMTISLKDTGIPARYFEQGRSEVAALFAGRR